mgnify:CR=1 FL=1
MDDPLMPASESKSYMAHSGVEKQNPRKGTETKTKWQKMQEAIGRLKNKIPVRGRKPRPGKLLIISFLSR